MTALRPQRPPARFTWTPSETEVIDAHAHLGPYSRFFIPDSGIDAMVGVMDRTATAVTVLSSNLAIQSDAQGGNRATATAVDSHPSRIRGYAVVNPWQDPDGEISRLDDDQRFVGIKIHPSLHHYPVDGQRYQPVWEYAEATGCPVLSHTDQDSAVDRPGLFVGIAERWPTARILLGHAGITPAGVDAAIEVGRRTEHTYLEVCGSQMSGLSIGDMVAAVGAGRVVFGSDFPFIDQRSSLGRVVAAPLTATERTAVLGGAARALFGWRRLPGPGHG